MTDIIGFLKRMPEFRTHINEGMISCVGEYTPPEFWEALDIIDALIDAAGGVPLNGQAPDDPVAEGYGGADPHAEPDAPAANALTDLSGRCADILRRHYKGTGEAMAWEGAIKVLEEVQRTYEQLAAMAEPGARHDS